MFYLEINFIQPSQETSDILIAMLSDLQFEGFAETDYSLKAFISKLLFNKEQLNEIGDQFHHAATYMMI